jgi:hypothetical protein
MQAWDAGDIHIHFAVLIRETLKGELVDSFQSSLGPRGGTMVKKKGVIRVGRQKKKRDEVASGVFI